MQDFNSHMSRLLTDICLSAMRSDHPLPCYMQAVRRPVLAVALGCTAVIAAAMVKSLIALFAIGTLTATVLGALTLVGGIVLLPPMVKGLLCDPVATLAMVDGMVGTGPLAAARRNLLHHLLLLASMLTAVGLGIWVGALYALA